MSSEIIGKDIYIKAQDILNESSIIQAQDKLSIEGTNLINRAYMFEYGLQYRYTTRGTSDELDWGVWHTESYYNGYSAVYPYIYFSLTAGKIVGGNIDIKLIGKFSQDEFGDGEILVRQKDKEGKKNISSIDGDEIKIEAKEVVNSGKINGKEGLTIKTEGDVKNNNGIMMGEAMAIKTGKDFITEVSTRQRRAGDGVHFNKVDTDIDETGYINAGMGGIKIEAGGEISISAMDVISGGDTVIKADKGINLTGKRYTESWKVDSHDDYGYGSQEQALIGKMYINATISGANIIAKEKLDVKVSNNLLIESLQDSYYNKGSGYNVGASVGIGEKGYSNRNSVGASYGNNKSYSDINWVNEQTSLTGGNFVDISVGNKTTIKGAVIANSDVNYDNNVKVVFGEDKGNLTIKTKELEYSDIKDKSINETNSLNIGINVGQRADKQDATKYPKGSLNIGATVRGQVKEQTTKATIGHGTIIIDGKNIDDVDSSSSSTHLKK